VNCIIEVYRRADFIVLLISLNIKKSTEKPRRNICFGFKNILSPQAGLLPMPGLP